MTDPVRPDFDPEAGLTNEDLERAGRIGALHARLWRLERLLAAADSRAIEIGLSVQPGQVSAVPAVGLRGLEAERLLSRMIDDTKGELQALL